MTVWDVGPGRLNVHVPRGPLAPHRGQSAWASHCRLAAGVSLPPARVCQDFFPALTCEGDRTRPCLGLSLVMGWACGIIGRREGVRIDGL